MRMVDYQDLAEGHITNPPENFSFPLISEGETKTNHTKVEKREKNSS